MQGWSKGENLENQEEHVYPLEHRAYQPSQEISHHMKCKASPEIVNSDQEDFLFCNGN